MRLDPMLARRYPYAYVYENNGPTKHIHGWVFFSESVRNRFADAFESLNKFPAQHAGVRRVFFGLTSEIPAEVEALVGDFGVSDQHFRVWEL